MVVSMSQCPSLSLLLLIEHILLAFTFDTAKKQSERTSYQRHSLDTSKKSQYFSLGVIYIRMTFAIHIDQIAHESDSD